ncbi:hypothetical protein VTO73DRAFT_6066 [Trametes versicolor]
MAPVLSHPWGPLPLPADLVWVIASSLPRQDQYAILLTSWSLHDIVAPILYRSVEIWIQPVMMDAVIERDPRPFNILSNLAHSARYANSPQPSRCYAAHILTLSYVGLDLSANFRALPLLAEVCRVAERLHHLRLDVDSNSISLFMDTFIRKQVVITLTNPANRWRDREASASILPRLVSIRSSKPAIVESLMRFRNVEIAVVDSSGSTEVFSGFFVFPSALRCDQLTHFSYCIHPDDCILHLHAVSKTFPQLHHLSLRCTPGLTEEVFGLALAILQAEPFKLPHLRSFCVNHGRISITYQDLLETSAAEVRIVGSDRSSLDTVIVGAVAQ